MHQKNVTLSKQFFNENPMVNDWISKDGNALVLRVTDLLTLEEKHIYVNKADKLGGGAHGSVYKGIYLEGEGGIVAVKVFNKDKRVSTKLEVVVSEAKHIGIAHKIAAQPIFSKKKFYIVMEYINGRPLAKKGELNPDIAKLDFEERVEIAFFLSQRLFEIHRGKAPMLHLDIKAENILLDTKRKLARFVDFGYAKVIPTESTGLVSLEYPRGTTAYCAPEVMLASKASEKSDIFSLALVLLILFSSKDPQKFRNEKWHKVKDALEKKDLLKTEQKKNPDQRRFNRESVSQQYCYTGFCNELEAPDLGFNAKAALLGFIMQMGSLNHDKRPGTAMLAEFMRVLNNACKINRYNATAKAIDKRSLFSDKNKALLQAHEAKGAQVLLGGCKLTR